MKYIITKQKSRFALFVLYSFAAPMFIASIVSIVIFCNLIFAIIADGFNGFDNLYFSIGTFLEMFFSVALIYIEFYLINYIFWQYRGYEEIEMNDKELIISRKGKIIDDKIAISLNEIKSIEEQYYEPETFFSSIWNTPARFSRTIGEIGGRILVRYGKKIKWKIDFGLGLTKEDAKKYVQEMNDILQKNKLEKIENTI
ncbi:MAG: hypothetical protein LBN95_09720 [Prevotellaceae bacterium]|jgi:hypothetical protein|nr:hypothetical protein [Prevotellaceae bacterium]